MQRRIAMISMHSCPLSGEEGREGGMEVYVMELSKELSKLGYAVDVFTRKQNDDHKEIVEINPLLRIIHLKAGPTHPISKKDVVNYIHEFATNLETYTLKEHTEYVVLHSNYYLSGLVGIYLKTKFGWKTPHIMTFHTLALMKNLVARDELEREQKERIEAEMKIAKESDMLILSGENDAQYLEYLYDCPKEKITVVNPGVNIELFYPTDKDSAKKKIGGDLDHKIILFVGRIQPLKGLDTVMYAIKIIQKQNPKLKICFWIVGGDISQGKELWSEELRKLEKLQRYLKIETVVKFVGHKPQRELPDYYNAAEVAVMPSHYESFGISALEAMACGTPVITTNVTGISNLIASDEKYVTTANNPLLLASQIEDILKNEKKHEDLSKKIYNQAKQYTWKKTAKKISEVYENLLSITISK